MDFEINFKINKKYIYWYVYKFYDCINISKWIDLMSNFGNNDEKYDDMKKLKIYFGYCYYYFLFLIFNYFGMLYVLILIFFICI